MGAYQEILGDLHNLFGDTDAVHVRIDDGDYRVDHVVEGDSVAEVLSYVQYNKEDLVSRVRRAVEAALREKRLTIPESGRFMKRYEEALEGYTYLSRVRPAPRDREHPWPSDSATPLTRHAGIEVPLICGAMYPCSNPELVAAVSEAGGIGIVQPISLTYVHGHEFREGLRLIRRLTAKPIGMNALIEKSSKPYLERMERWVDIALEEGVRFFVTSLGNPRWVVERVHAAGGVVYHDVTEREVGGEGRATRGVDGLIAVNARAGGHAGGALGRGAARRARALGLPVVCAGGIGDEREFVRALRMGYAGVQLGTRFIATPECRASDAYKQAIVDGRRARHRAHRAAHRACRSRCIDTPYVQRLGTKAGPARALDAARPPHEALDAHALRAALALGAQARAAARLARARLLAGREERRGDRADRAGRRDRAPLRRGLAGPGRGLSRPLRAAGSPRRSPNRCLLSSDSDHLHTNT